MAKQSVWRRVRTKLACALLGPGLAVAWPLAAVAAVEIKIASAREADLTLVEISGVIDRGDAQRVQAFLAALPAGKQIAVSLISEGGAIDEALRIGRHLHANRIQTFVVGNGRECVSACALVFLGGRDADGASYRVKGAAARIGFHGFRRVVPDKEFTVADMKEAVASTQQALLAIADYLTQIGAGIEFMSMMLDKPNTEMNYLTNEKALALGVHVLDESTGRLVRGNSAAR
jgi:hypothetical protein